MRAHKRYIEGWTRFALLLVPVLPTCFGAFTLSAVAQPPAPDMEYTEFHLPEIEEKWNKLRAETGATEFTQPMEAIEKYSRFYEQQGKRSATTAVKISRAIAQIYWQMLGDHNKAVEIYNWMVDKFGDLPQMSRLAEERDAVMRAKSHQEFVTIAPIRLGSSISAPSPLKGIKPIGTASVASSKVIKPSSPVSAMQSEVVTSSSPASIVPSEVIKPTAEVAIPGNVSLLRTAARPDPISAIFKITSAPANSMFMPSAIEMASVLYPDLSIGKMDVYQNADTQLDLEKNKINTRLSALRNYLRLWQDRKISWEKFLEESKLTPEDVILITSTRWLVSHFNQGTALRIKLGEFIQKFPELVDNWQKLPVTAQVGLAEAYTKQNNELAETIFLHLLKQDVPQGAWWNKELITYRFAAYHSARKEYEKAAELNLEIASFTKNAAWHNDSLIVAARLYRRAGKEEKASELYKRAENGSHGWAKGMALFDQASELLGQGKHNEALRLLSTPVSGRQSDQIQPVLFYGMAAAHFRGDNWQEARKYAQKAVDSFAQLTNPVLNEGVEQKVSGAQYILDFMKYWSKEPVISLPREIRLHKRGQNETVPFIVRCVLHSYADIPISVVADMPGVKTWVAQAGRPASTGVFDSYARDLVIQVDPVLVRSGSIITLQISSPKHPAFKALLPIHVVAG